MRRLLVTAAILFAPALALHAQAPTLPSADTVLSHAKSTAAAEHKNILLTFSASWCGPCHLFEHFLEDPAIKPIMEKAFVIATLDVEERADDPHHADSPGGEALMASLGGAQSGVPFITMLTPTGKPIVDSLRPDNGGKSNVGYPAIPVEIDWFMHMLERAAPTLSPADRATVKQWLDAHMTHH
jgi:thiol-disulfide isomerase/thioredoxin